MIIKVKVIDYSVGIILLSLIFIMVINTLLLSSAWRGAPTSTTCTGSDQGIAFIVCLQWFTTSTTCTGRVLKHHSYLLLERCSQQYQLYLQRIMHYIQRLPSDVQLPVLLVIVENKVLLLSSAQRGSVTGTTYAGREYQPLH